MNQILSTENNSKQKKTRNSELLDMRKIIIIFSILIILFALIIVGAKVYGMIKEKSKEKDKDNPNVYLNQPDIKIEVTDNICTLTVIYDEGLDRVVYWWNDETVIDKPMNGSTTPLITTIAIPEGDYNVLHVKATGIDGSSNELNQDFVSGEQIQDLNKPKITTFYNEETAQIDIVARSSKGMKKLTYKWEDEEEVVIESAGENQKELKATIDAKRGLNRLYINATDVEGNTQSKDIPIQAIRSTKFKVTLENNKTIVMNVKHDMGFKKVIFNVNGNEYVYDENNPEYSVEKTDLTTSIDMPPGTVVVKIRAYTLEQENKEDYFEASTQIMP